jgi:hypothetical protein
MTIQDQIAVADGHVVEAIKQNTLLQYALVGLMASLRDHDGWPAEQVDEVIDPLHDITCTLGNILLDLRQALGEKSAKAAA